MKRFVSQEGLKLLACMTMFLDHYGAILAPWMISYRVIGRLSFPVFCFLLAEGAHRTRSPGKYVLRLFIAALISELPFDYAFFGKVFWYNQNVMITLLLGLLELYGSSRLQCFLFCLWRISWRRITVCMVCSLCCCLD